MTKKETGGAAKSVWSDDLTVCNSCNKAYANEATHYGFPALAAGGNSPDPWPLCDMHAFPMALIAGWKPVKIADAMLAERSK